MESRRPSSKRSAKSRRPGGMRRNLCGKVSFLTLSGAETAAMLQGERHRVDTRAYWCPLGHGWHLTTQVRRTTPAPSGG